MIETFFLIWAGLFLLWEAGDKDDNFMWGVYMLTGIFALVVGVVGPLG